MTNFEKQMEHYRVALGGTVQKDRIEVDEYLNALEVCINCKIEMALMPADVQTEIKAKVMTTHARASRIMAEFLEQNRPTAI